MAKYKIGDQFSFGRSRRAVRAVGEIEEGAVYFLEFFNENGEVTAFESHTERYIDNHYSKIEPFFEVGKTYKTDYFKYRVVSIHEHNRKKYASAEVYSLDGAPVNDMLCLNEKAFLGMTEV